MGAWNPKGQHAARSDFVIGQLNISKEPFMKTLHADDIVIPVNHVLTGIVKKALVQLEKKLGGEATEVRYNSYCEVIDWI